MSRYGIPAAPGSEPRTPILRTGSLLGWGVALTMLGTIAIQVGFQLDASAYLSWMVKGSRYSYGPSSPGAFWIVVGGIGALIGIVTFVVGLNRLSRNVDRIAELVAAASPAATPFQVRHQQTAKRPAPVVSPEPGDALPTQDRPPNPPSPTDAPAPTEPLSAAFDRRSHAPTGGEPGWYPDPFREPGRGFQRRQWSGTEWLDEVDR